jgi:hypothetical protein
MRHSSLLIISIFFISFAIIDIAKTDPSPNSIAEIHQSIQFYGELILGFVCYIGYLILKQLNQNK